MSKHHPSDELTLLQVSVAKVKLEKALFAALHEFIAETGLTYIDVKLLQLEVTPIGGAPEMILQGVSVDVLLR